MNIFQNYLASEFAEDYAEGRMTRREALKLIASVTGSMVVANTFLAACTSVAEETLSVATAEASPFSDSTSVPSGANTAVSPESNPTETTMPTEAPAGTVNPEDLAVEGSDIVFPGDGTEIMAYLARPVGDGPYPVILVCHENRGLTDHIKDVARRLASAGYVALAVDLLSRQGGSSEVGFENVPGALGNLTPDQFFDDFYNGWRYLSGLPYVQAERVGMVGFCFGGGVTWLVATRMAELRAAVPFYGPHPLISEVPKIQAAVLGIYAERDQRINQGIPAIEEAMRENSKIYEKVIYPDSDHAFHNDTGTRYNHEAALDAWQRTLDWFEQYV
jgi:carboxymethylenebutenolidase